MTKKLEYRELFEIHPVLLLKKDLSELEEILLEDPETDQIDIKLIYDSSTIQAADFNELLATPNLPSSTDKLSINMQRWIETEDYKGIFSGVSLSLHYNHINCQVHSLDQTWFLGKKAQLENFFKLRKPWYLILNKISYIYPSIALLLMYYSAALLGMKQYYQMILPVFCSIVLIIVTTLIGKQKIFPYVKIYLQERTNREFGFYEWCALIGALSGFATLIQILSKLLI